MKKKHEKEIREVTKTVAAARLQYVNGSHNINKTNSIISELHEENNNISDQNQKLMDEISEIKTKNLRLTRYINRIQELMEADNEKTKGSDRQDAVKAMVQLSNIRTKFIDLKYEYDALENKYNQLVQEQNTNNKSKKVRFNE